jgi:hypothetical protein
MNHFGKKEILNLLREFDSLIKKPVTIIICGGAAGILEHGFNRGTLDIDIIHSLPRLIELEDIRKMIADQYDLSDQWLNDGAKGFIDYLPDDFQSRLIPVKIKFKKLNASVLGKADLLVMKLAAFRPEDLLDLSRMNIDKDTIPIIKRTVNKIALFDNKKAHIMTLFLKEKGLWRKDVL